MIFFCQTNLFLVISQLISNETKNHLLWGQFRNQTIIIKLSSRKYEDFFIVITHLNKRIIPFLFILTLFSFWDFYTPETF